VKHRIAACTVAAAFADEREASYAVRLISASPEIDARFTLRQVRSERDELQLVVLEVTVTDPRLRDRLETCMEGAHGAVIPTDVVEQAVRAS